MEATKQSGLGIASFIIGMVSGIFIFLLIVVAAIMEKPAPSTINEDSVGAAMLGLFLLFFMGTSILALGLGIIGVIQKERKKFFPIAGTVISVVTLFATLMLVLIGMAMS